MLLLIALTLKGRIEVAQPIPPPTPTPPFGDSGRKVRYPKADDDLEKRRRIRIEIEDSEIIAIVELTLRNFII